MIEKVPMTVIEKVKLLIRRRQQMEERGGGVNPLWYQEIKLLKVRMFHVKH